MNQITPSIRLMSPEEVRSSRLINAGSVLEYEDTAIPIAAGRSDLVHVFTESTVLYVLSINYKLEYIGLEIFDAGSGEEYETIFVSYDWELLEYLGTNWKDIPPLQIVARLKKLLI